MLPVLCFAQGTKVYFSPNGGCRDEVVSQISKARKSIDIAMYDFTSWPIAKELLKAKKSGVVIRIVLDKAQETQASSMRKYLTQKGFELRFHNGPGLMHNKFAIIDGQTLLTGSFNWTISADLKNEENLIVLTDAGVIRDYERRFEYIYRGSSKKGKNLIPARHQKHNESNLYFHSPVRFFR